MSENIYRLTKTEADKLGRLLHAAMDHVNEDGVAVTEEEATNARRSERPAFGVYLNGFDDAKITEEIRKWSGHNRIGPDHVKGHRRALYGNLWKPKTEKKNYYTPTAKHIETLKGEIELRIDGIEKRVVKLEEKLAETFRLALGEHWNKNHK
jgi:hypothetical protein